MAYPTWRMRRDLEKSNAFDADTDEMSDAEIREAYAEHYGEPETQDDTPSLGELPSYGS